MNHLESVSMREEGVSHWIATGPAGMRVEWDARIINEVPDKVIGWQSLDGSTISTDCHPNNLATAAPSFPPGGLYWRWTVTRVPCGSSSKFTDPAVEIVDPSSDCHPITLSSTSLMMRASHSTRMPAGPVAIQCETPSSRIDTDSRWFMNFGRFSKLRQKR